MTTEAIGPYRPAVEKGKPKGVWRIEAAIDKHCWGQRCYLFSNPEAYGDVRYHMMAVTFWTGNGPPRGVSGQPGFAYPPMCGWPTQRWM